jgi:integrase
VGRRGCHRPARGPRRTERHEQAKRKPRPRQGDHGASRARVREQPRRRVRLHPDVQVPGVGCPRRKAPDAHITTITGARQWREDARSALRAGTLTADRGPTLREAADEWLPPHAQASPGTAPVSRTSGPRSVATSRTSVSGCCPSSGTSACARSHCRSYSDSWIGSPPDGHAAATITTTITPLRAIYRRARQLGEAQTNPVSGISVPSVNRRQERFATVTQVEAILSKLDRPKDRAAWATAIYAGLRRGELMALRREDVDLAAG